VKPSPTVSICSLSIHQPTKNLNLVRFFVKLVSLTHTRATNSRVGWSYSFGHFNHLHLLLSFYINIGFNITISNRIKIEFLAQFSLLTDSVEVGYVKIDKEFLALMPTTIRLKFFHPIKGKSYFNKDEMTYLRTVTGL
jgi:hypothetical protein